MSVIVTRIFHFALMPVISRFMDSGLSLEALNTARLRPLKKDWITQRPGCPYLLLS